MAFGSSGINGLCVSAQSGNVGAPAGTVTIFAGSSTLSGDNGTTNFTLDFVVGDVVHYGGNPTP